jgi:acetyl-CoA C-acetyltransferase
MKNSIPVLVGVAAVSQRLDDPLAAKEPLELMIDVVNAAAEDAGAPDLLPLIEWIGIPHGRWDYSDPGRAIAQRIGASGARTVLAEVGVLQQTLIGDACQRIRSGEHDVTVVIGAEAGHRIRRARLTGNEISAAPAAGTPDVVLRPQLELKAAIELDAGLDRAVGYYAMLESSFRTAMGLTVDENRDRIAAIYSRLSTIAAQNPYAWRRQEDSAASLRAESSTNPMMSFPYTRAFVSSWSVDQAGALLFCSLDTARRLGIPDDRCIYPLASSESNHMLAVSQRQRLADPPAVHIAVNEALSAAGVAVGDLDLVDLYSCFPVAVEMFAQALEIDPLVADVTVTGGMPFAGGPYNNYVIQSTVRMAQLLRGRQTGIGMTTCVSGLMTKIGVGLWGVAPPERGFENVDVSELVGQQNVELETVRHYSGAATVVAYTVLHRPAGPTGILLLDTADGRRTMASIDDGATLQSMERDEWVGRRLQLHGGEVQ